MSGGHWDDLPFLLQEASNELTEIKTKEELEFGNHLKEIAKLLKSLDYAVCGDSSMDKFQKDWKEFKERLLK